MGDANTNQKIHCLRLFFVIVAIFTYALAVTIFMASHYKIGLNAFKAGDVNKEISLIELEAPSQTIHLSGRKNTVHESIDGMISTVDLNKYPSAFTKAVHRTADTSKALTASLQILEFADACSLHEMKEVNSDFTHEDFENDTALSEIKWEKLTYNPQFHVRQRRLTI